MFFIKEWYLITPQTQPNLTGGYENESYVDYKDDAFAEVLATDIASTVILYNYDLSESKKIRCVIQDNTADTYLKSVERNGLFICGTVKAGMYIYFENSYWLITGRPGTNGIYEKASLQLCQHKLRWQNESGEIIERWCYAASASKYDRGREGNNAIILTTDNLALLLPDDDESMELEGKRVFIDRRKVPKKVYEITRDDNVLYDYGVKGGIIGFIADKTELNLETDNQELRLCDYIPPTTLPPSVNETTISSPKIDGNPNLVPHFTRTYTAIFKKCDENSIENGHYTWNVVSDFEVQQTLDGNNIKLSVNDEDLIGSSFYLQILEEGAVVSELEITVSELI